MYAGIRLDVGAPTGLKNRETIWVGDIWGST